MVYYKNGEPDIRLSPLLSDILFSPSSSSASLPLGPSLVINDLAADFPYFYFTRILKDAEGEGINLTNQDELALFGVNWFRKKLGLAALINNQKLQKAAKDHAAYLINNGIIKKMQQWDVESVNLNDYLALHDEKKGKRGYSGTTPLERTKKAGYSRVSTECATLTYGNVLLEVINWFHTIFHRRPFLSEEVVEYGHGHKKGAGENETVGISNWGMDTSIRSEGFVIYPYKNEKNVPYAWSAIEAPDPFPGSSETTGPPITAAFTSPLYTKGELRLFDAKNNEVSCAVSSVIPAAGRFIEITPLRPLQPGSTYRIRFTYQDKNYEHSFTTAPLNPAKREINRLTRRLGISFDFRQPDFDVKKAMKLSAEKGKVKTVRIGGRDFAADTKYEFAFAIPRGWEIDKNRKWQEVLLKKEWRSINVMLYIPGNDRSYETLNKKLASGLNYPLVSKTYVEKGDLSGHLLEYSWKHDGKVLCYYLLYREYALGIYGYGVSEQEMEEIFSTFRHYE